MGTFIISAIPTIMKEATIGYVDICVAVYLTVSAIMLYNWLKTDERIELLLLSGFFVGAAAWTKNDGFAHLTAMSIIIAIYLLIKACTGKVGAKSLLASFFGFILVAAAVSLPFKMLTAIYGIKNHMIGDSSQFFSFFSNFNRAPYILSQFVYEFFLNTSCWLYFWVFIFAILLVNWRRALTTELKYLLGFICLSLAAFFGVFMITSLGDTPEHLVGNLGELNRLLLHVAPTAGFLMLMSAFGKDNS